MFLAVTENWRKSRFFLISLCIHIAAFISLGMIVLNGVPEPREYVSVQLVKATQQVRKPHRDIPRFRSQIINRADLPKKSQDAAKLLINQDSIPSQVATEVIPVFQYEPVAPKKPGTYPQMVSLRKPLAMPKPVIRGAIMPGHRGSAPFGIHDQLSRLSSPYSSVHLSAHSTSDSAILQNFLQIVNRRIEKSKRYPKWAIDAGFEGKVVVRFTILRDGTLDEDIQLIRSSGTEVLDNAAIAAVKDAAPFPSLPRSLSRERLQIELPMNFRLGES